MGFFSMFKKSKTLCKRCILAIFFGLVGFKCVSVWAYLIFVTSTTSGAGVKFFSLVSKNQESMHFSSKNLDLACFCGVKNLIWSLFLVSKFELLVSTKWQICGMGMACWQMWDLGRRQIASDCNIWRNIWCNWCNISCNWWCLCLLASVGSWKGGDCTSSWCKCTIWLMVGKNWHPLIWSLSHPIARAIEHISLSITEEIGLLLFTNQYVFKLDTN